MNLIKIGDRYFNMDLAVDIRAGEKGVAIQFAVPNGGGVYTATVGSAEVVALQQWLDEHATVITGGVG